MSVKYNVGDKIYFFYFIGEKIKVEVFYFFLYTLFVNLIFFF